MEISKQKKKTKKRRSQIKIKEMSAFATLPFQSAGKRTSKLKQNNNKNDIMCLRRTICCKFRFNFMHTWTTHTHTLAHRNIYHAKVGVELVRFDYKYCHTNKDRPTNHGHTHTHIPILKCYNTTIGSDKTPYKNTSRKNTKNFQMKEKKRT